MEEYDYFMIRIRRAPAGQISAPISGMVERLGTGEKRTFASSEELLGFVGCGKTPHAKDTGEGAGPQ